MPTYFKTLKSAWRLTWKNKFLWAFGFFAALFLDNGNEYNAVIGGARTIIKKPFLTIDNLGKTLNLETIWKELRILISYDTRNAVAILLFAITTALFFSWLSAISKGAIVHCLDKLYRRKKTGLKDGISAGLKNFWPVLAISIIFKAAAYFFLATAIILALAISPRAMPSTGKVLSFVFPLLLVPVFMILSFISRYSLYYAVLEKKKISFSISESFVLFKRNWLASLEAALLLFFINIALGMALAAVILITAAPLAFFGLLFYYSASLFGFWSILAVGIVLVGGIFALGKSLFSVFQFAAWLKIFQKLTNERERVTSKTASLLKAVRKWWKNSG